jgi:hypothetical protein
MKPQLTERSPSCDCQTPGLFQSGVPGVLAQVVQGRLVPDTPVWHCPRCRRYPHDDAALAALRALGIAGDGPPAAATYTVQCYVTLRVTLTGIVADDAHSAAMTARDRFCLDEQGSEAEFVDEVSTFLVTADGDTDPAKAVAFRVNWSPVPVDDPEEEGPHRGSDERRPP